MTAMELRRVNLLVAGLCVAVAGCSDSPPGRTYFERNIQPILTQKCAGNTSGCHSTNPDDPYDVRRRQPRRHVVRERPEAARRARAVRRVSAPAAADQGGRPAAKLQRSPVRRRRSVPDIDVQHSRWRDPRRRLRRVLHAADLARERRDRERPQAADARADRQRRLLDRDAAGLRQGGLRSTSRDAQYFGDVQAQVQPILERHGCTAGNCHGAPQSDFYITCGDDDEQLAFNFSQAWSFVNTRSTTRSCSRAARGRGGRPRPHRRRSVRGR